MRCFIRVAFEKWVLWSTPEVATLWTTSIQIYFLQFQIIKNMFPACLPSSIPPMFDLNRYRISDWQGIISGPKVAADSYEQWAFVSYFQLAHVFWSEIRYQSKSSIRLYGWSEAMTTLNSTQDYCHCLRLRSFIRNQTQRYLSAME